MKKSPKPRDLSQLANAIVSQSVSEQIEPDQEVGKDSSAVARGHLGGKKGGKARAEKLTSRERTIIARHAAEVRWQHRHSE